MDTVKPTGSVVINDEDVKVGTINVKVKVIASDDSGVDKYHCQKTPNLGRMDGLCSRPVYDFNWKAA